MIKKGVFGVFFACFLMLILIGGISAADLDAVEGGLAGVEGGLENVEGALDDPSNYLRQEWIKIMLQ